MAAVPEQLSVDAVKTSVLSELENLSSLKQEKNDTEGFS